MFTKNGLLKKKFYCGICNFSSDYKCNLEKHLKTQKHKNRVLSGPKNNLVFRCEICDFSTSKLSKLERHKTTLKHKKVQKKVQKVSVDSDENSEKSQINEYFCECGKKYKYRQSLHVHRKKCMFIKETETKDHNDQKDTDIETESDIKQELKNTNKKLELCMDIIQNQVIPNMQPAAITNNNIMNNTTNNNFNLNIFLNETCKDAINITEFIENLKVGLRELEFVRENGIVKGISNVFVNELNALDVDKRPIHCTDVKRKTLYIKDDDKWDKENKAINEKIDRSIQHVKKKHVDSIKEWEEQHPNWCDDEKLAMEYLRMVRNSTTPIDQSGEKKIISEVAAEVDISEIKNKGGD